MDALGILFSPVKLFRENLIRVLFASLARSDIGSIGERISEKSLHVG